MKASAHLKLADHKSAVVAGSIGSGMVKAAGGSINDDDISSVHRLQSALGHLKEVLDAKKALFGVESREVAKAHWILGSVHAKLSNSRVALLNFKAALSISSKTGGLSEAEAGALIKEVLALKSSATVPATSAGGHGY